MAKVTAIAFILMLALGAGAGSADDLTGATRLLCAPIQAAVCVEDGECEVDVPWSLNIPQFVEVDLEAGRLATTAASGENRMTPIEHLRRSDGTIVLHGYEMGRAFSWVVNERTGHVTAAVAADGVAVSVFGVCTPLDRAANARSKGARP
jgi:hypothetical protein